jgi:hypothetical protein
VVAFTTESAGATKFAVMRGPLQFAACTPMNGTPPQFLGMFSRNCGEAEFEIKKMLEFLIDNIFVVDVGQVLQQSFGIPMSTNCALC